MLEGVLAKLLAQVRGFVIGTDGGGVGVTKTMLT
jgi:hypothetical protein